MSFLSLEHALNYIVQKVSWAAYQHHVVPKRGKVRYTFLNKTKKGPRSDRWPFDYGLRYTDRTEYEQWFELDPLDRLPSLII